MWPDRRCAECAQVGQERLYLRPIGTIRMVMGDASELRIRGIAGRCGRRAQELDARAVSLVSDNFLNPIFS